MLARIFESSLRKKLIASYLVLILLPMCALSVFASVRTSRIVLSRSREGYMAAAQQAAKSVDDAMEGILRTANLAQNQASFVANLRMAAQNRIASGEEYNCYTVLEAARQAILNERGVTNAMLALESDAAFVGEYLPFFPMQTLLDEDILKEMRGQSLWLDSGRFSRVRLNANLQSWMGGPHTQVLVRRVSDLSNVQRTLGYLLVEVDDAYLTESIANFSLPTDALILVRSESAVIRAKGSLALSGALPAAGGDESVTINGARYMAIRKPVAQGLWELVLLVSEDELTREGASLRNAFMLLAVSLSAAAIIFAFLLTRNIDRRLKGILGGIRHIEKGAFGYVMKVEGKDEYARLAMAYNDMSLRVKALVQDVYDAQAREKEVEMRLLYERLNPHFIYNTLDIIHWDALRQGAPRVAALANSLVRYLRKNLNHGRTLIRLTDEVQGVESYMHIMSYRYQGSVTFEAAVSPAAGGAEIIKLILQPLVENALLHGVLCKEEKTGVIRVKAFVENDETVLRVEDDGVGMPQTQADEILARESDHYGLRNVYFRIRTFYGQAGDMRICTQPGQGFSVVIRMPYTAFKGE